ncbi:MAG: LamG-like jellyroll fold domain-containing protein [Sedimentisphaerales bacterium]
MKSRMIWMALAAVILVSTNAWALWNPDTDPCLVFNMNFETYSNAAHTTTSTVLVPTPAPPHYPVGTLDSYNDVNYNVFGETSATGLGKDANFAAVHDFSAGAAVGSDGPCPNDVRLVVPGNTAIFDLGLPAVKHTWTFWFNAPSITDGTIIRHASNYAYYYLFDPDNYNTYRNYIWEIRIYGGKLTFYHKNNCLKMETASTLSDLGLTVNTWHHAAVVIDRSTAVETSVPTTQQSCKIYIDGLEVPIIVTSVNTLTMNINSFYDSPLWIGAGERVFNGLLDEVRLFTGDLNSVQVSLLYQCDKTLPIALLPIPRSSGVVIGTGLSWVPAGSTPAPTGQSVYFGTDVNNMSSVATGNGSMNSVSNAQLGGLLTLNTTYYWYIRSTISGNDVNGPLWSFTTETGKAINPSPIDGAIDINDSNVHLSWTTPTTATYTVYASSVRSLVESNDISVRIANGISDPCVIYDPCSRGQIFCWRVDSNYGGSIGTVTGDIWSFRTKPYELVFNTDDAATTYADHAIPGLTCVLHSSGWSDPCATATLDGNVAVFNFPNGFNYDRRYDIVVVPSVRPQDTDINTSTPLAIHVTGDFYFDGRVQIAGDDITTTSQLLTYARSGGFPGPKNNQDTSVWTTTPRPAPADYWNSYTFNPANSTTIFHNRFGNDSTPSGTAHYIYEPTDAAKRAFGPGIPVNPPYKGGGGGGAGGVGGDSGRGYYYGVFSGGPSYGDKEVPVPFGGSGGGWGGSSSPGGAAGGGGIEIVTTGNVTLDVNSQILAHGGSQLCSSTGYPGGGGGGGSVRIIAGGSVTNRGIIDVNGGKGGDGSSGNNLGGGGGGGRVAIFYGTTYSNTGTIAANGGFRGAWYNDPCDPGLPCGLAKSGQNGTIYVVNSSTVSPKKASAPTPKNGDKTVYTGHPDPCTIKLKWYSGYGGTTDVVYCDTNPTPTTSRGSVSATRGQHDVNMTVSSGNTYYMKVVTDGTVSSDIWSFSTRNWQCPLAVSGAYPHAGGLEWDTNHDCVIGFEDFEYFADDWLNSELGGYTLDFNSFAWFANEWRQCANRTDGGCAGF